MSQKNRFMALVLGSVSMLVAQVGMASPPYSGHYPHTNYPSQYPQQRPQQYPQQYPYGQQQQVPGYNTNPYNGGGHHNHHHGHGHLALQAQQLVDAVDCVYRPIYANPYLDYGSKNTAYQLTWLARHVQRAIQDNQIARASQLLTQMSFSNQTLNTLVYRVRDPRLNAAVNQYQAVFQNLSNALGVQRGPINQYPYQRPYGR